MEASSGPEETGRVKNLLAAVSRLDGQLVEIVVEHTTTDDWIVLVDWLARRDLLVDFRPG